MFQALIGTAKTTLQQALLEGVEAFQALIGTAKTNFPVMKTCVVLFRFKPS